MTNLRLGDFAAVQEIAINKAARQLRQLLEINITYDVEEGARRVLEGNPYLRGVSVRDITSRILR